MCMKIKPEILTRGGHYISLVNPDVSKLTIGDIAMALAYTCRFGGHTLGFYSVAQHSVLVSHVVPPHFAKAALLHDAAEAIVGDVPAPLKQLLPEYKRIEARIESAIMQHFGIPYPLPPVIKHADRVLLATERRDLMPHTNDTWALTDGIKPLPNRIEPLNPLPAAEAFINRWHQLCALEAA